MTQGGFAAVRAVTGRGKRENERPFQPRMDADGHSAAEPQPKKQGHEKHKKPQKGEP